MTTLIHIPEEVIAHLEAVFLRLPSTWETPPRQIDYLAGQQSVLRYLRKVQAGPDLERQRNVLRKS